MVTWCLWLVKRNTAWGKSRLTIVSTWNTEFVLELLFTYCIIFHTNNCEPTFVPSCNLVWLLIDYGLLPNCFYFFTFIQKTGTPDYLGVCLFVCFTKNRRHPTVCCIYCKTYREGWKFPMLSSISYSQSHTSLDKLVCSRKRGLWYVVLRSWNYVKLYWLGQKVYLFF